MKRKKPADFRHCEDIDGKLNYLIQKMIKRADFKKCLVRMMCH